MVAALMLGVVSAAMANGSKLNGVWFKLPVQAKGHSVNPVDGSFRSLNFPFPAYLHFVWDAANNR